MKRILFGSLIFVSLILGACNSNGSTTSTSKSTEKETPTTTEISKETEESTIGKQNDPVPLGNTATVDIGYYDDKNIKVDGNISVTLSHVLRGQEAVDYLITANQFNDEAPEGKEWIVFDVTLKLNVGNEERAYQNTGHFTAIDSAGNKISEEAYVIFENAASKILYPGDETTAQVALLVPVNDDALVEFNDFDTTILFSLK